MQNNTEKQFSIEDYAQFANKIMANAPVNKINFNLENPNAVAGMYLLLIEDTKKYLDGLVDKKDLNDNTLLVFQSRHVVECCQIIYGCMKALEGIKMTKVSPEYIIDKIISALLTKPIFYNKFSSEMDFIITSCLLTPVPDDKIIISKKFKYIMENIWFVPYGSIDNIAKEAIEEYKKELDKGENNE